MASKFAEEVLEVINGANKGPRDLLHDIKKLCEAEGGGGKKKKAARKSAPDPAPADNASEEGATAGAE
jgi:hypothetical protein